MSARLGAPDIMHDQEEYLSIVKEWTTLDEIVSVYHSCLEFTSKIEENKCLIKECQDAELTLLAVEENAELQSQLTEKREQLSLLLTPRDPRDDKNVIMEIRAGAGGEEAALFVSDLYRMYSMFAQQSGYGIEVIFQNQTELGGYREIDFTVSGKGAFSKLKYESGVHRVQRVPKTESQGRIQTSTVTVAVLTEVDSVQVSINPQDVRIESCKSSGAGGQHVNKTESAVRLTHVPTGIVVECQEERSQLRNREKAMRLLEARLYHMMSTEQNDRIADDRKKQVGTGERCERIRTYNFPQSRLTDHRIGYTIYTLDKFMNGDIAGLIDALQKENIATTFDEDI